MEPLHQGDILKIEKIKHPVLVASQDFFNTSGEIIGDFPCSIKIAL
jgi:hypothetical protein